MGALARAELAAAVRRIADTVIGWTPQRWAGAALAVSDAEGISRADVMVHLIGRIADLGADAEGRPYRPVPRFDHDQVLGVQLQVVAADLLAAPTNQGVLTAALSEVVVHRRELDESVGLRFRPELCAALDLADVPDDRVTAELVRRCRERDVSPAGGPAAAG